MKGLHHGIEQLKRDVKSAEEQREAAQSEIEKVKTKQREVAREKDFLLLRKETAEKFKNPQQKKKFF